MSTMNNNIAYFLQEHVATKLAKYEIAEDDMLLGERLGVGGYGAVYKGFWLSKGAEVAAKKCTGVDKVDMTDANIMHQLGEHPHIVSFCGYIKMSTGTISIIMQFVKNGSLYDHLHEKGNKPSLQQSLTWAKQISYAISSLHSKDIAHLDLKSSNVLLSDSMEALICDFGTSRKVEQTTKLSDETGTRRWMAPEITKGSLNKACDVYSFAMVLWELVEHRIPFFEEKEGIQVSIKAMKGERPSIGKTWPEYLAELVQVCWDDNPQKRPKFTDIIQSLNSKQVIISPP